MSSSSGRRKKGKKGSKRRKRGRSKRDRDDGRDPLFVKKVVFFVVVLAVIMAGVVALAYVTRTQGRDSVVDDGGPSGENDPNGDNNGWDSQTFDFTVTDIDGNPFTLSEQSSKLVLVDLMATWCGPCTDELPELRIVEEELGPGNIQIISIDIDVDGEDDETLRQYRDDNGVTWPMAMDTPGLNEKHDVKAIPTLVLYDTKGYVKMEWEGMRTSDEILEGCNQFL